MKYLFPPREGTSIGPHTSEYTMCKILVALDAVNLLNAVLVCLLTKQLSQTLLGI
ncbi:unnamed protein product [Lupinus luteus]|uniref:Uncharacterized protein n=1 Tax=Lupinus luteus TaxID=3873 RepID=A0AAV1WKT3_LUPLU